MNEPEFDPNSLRNTIRSALGDLWTNELEEKLFWPLAAFNEFGCNKVREDTLRKIKQSLGPE